MKEEIIAYLQSPRNFYVGVALYEKYGANRMLKVQFRKIGETELIKKTLFEELRKLSGMSEEQFRQLKQFAFVPAVKTIVPDVKEDKKDYVDDRLLVLAKKFGVTVDELVSDDFREKILSSDENTERLEEQENELEELNEELDKARTQYFQVPEAIKKTIRFREEFPFLNDPDCPDELKVLVSDMFRAYDTYRAAHERLVNMPDNSDFDEAYKEASLVVENYLDNREMWEELEHYKETKEILGKAECMKELIEVKEISALSDLDLAKQISNAKPNISKARKALEKADSDDAKAKAEAALQKWNNRLSMLEKELEKRK